MRVITLLSALVAVSLSAPVLAAKPQKSFSTTITWNGTTYQYYGSSTCPDGSAALRYNRKWYCSDSQMKVASTTTDTTTTDSGSTTSTDTTTSSGSTTTDTTASTDTTSGTTTTTDTSTSTSATTAPTSYSAQLSWTIPTTRSDGTALTASELAGYEIYYTDDTGSVSAVVPVSGGSTASTTVASMAPGNYSFAISAIDSAGLKSSLSSVVSVSFQ
jgi:hypothetical protein